MIKLVVYFLFLITASVLAVISILKKKSLRENATFISYVLFGILFETLFLTIKPHDGISIQLYFSIFFPVILSVSIVYRLFQNFKISIIIYSILILCFYHNLNIADFVSINFNINITLHLALLVYFIKNGKLKWYYSIDSLIIINMYFMYITSLLSQKVISWDSSQLLESFHLTVSIFLIITLCFINVKLWRSSFN